MTRRVLITGANKGIGRATVAAVLSKHDDTFVYLGSRDLERGESTRKALVAEHSDWGDRIEVLQIDVSDDASVDEAVTRVDALYGIVNNAGIGFGSYDMKTVLNVNTRGPKRVCEGFIPRVVSNGRIVNVASASGPMFVSKCSPDRRRALTDGAVTWDELEAIMRENLALEAQGGDFAKAGFGEGNAYGLSKACLIAYTVELAREHPDLTINSCTPGFIETDMTRPMASGASPAEMGMKPPSEGTRATMHLLFGAVGGSGWYFGSDARRSPLDRYRAPGDPPFQPD